ncbi:MAG: DUF6600 domain-containing protein [Chitinophagaceae bacterium]
MSRLITTLKFAILAIVLAVASPLRSTAQGYSDGNGGYQQFYDELSPYGQWINDPQYGYVWVPDAGSDFRPYYSNGYWTNTDYGNTWVSSYPWGWAPFHYGRWTYNNYYGWVWVPGNVWGPAWVSWRSGGGSYGWAPLGPGISVSFSFGNSYYVPDNWWVFTPQRYIMNHAFQQYSYGPRYNSTYVHQTTIINNTYVTNNNTYISGPRRSELQRVTGQTIRPVPINTINRPGRATLSNNRLNIYRPQIAEAIPRSTERPKTFRPSERPIQRANPALQRSATGQQVEQRGSQATQPQRSQSVEQHSQPIQQQRSQQVEQQRTQQIQQQRSQQLEQQRSQQVEQQRSQQIQQQRSQQLEQQRSQQVEQQRSQQIQQQRSQQVEQQRSQQIQQQRSQQVEQQRSQQIQQQRSQPMQPQRMQQARPERSAPVRESAPARAPEERQR